MDIIFTMVFMYFFSNTNLVRPERKQALVYFCNTQSSRVEIESSVRDSSRLLTFIKPQILFYSNVFVRSMNENHDKKI